MRIAILSAALLVLAGCSDLKTINPDGRCGNGVIEPTNNEDCEPDRALPGNRACGIVGAINACRLVCDANPGGPRCPDGWGCGLDGICRSPAGALSAVNISRVLRTPMGFGDVDGNNFPDLVSVQTPRLLVGYGSADATYDSVLDVPVSASPKSPVVADGNNDGIDDIAVVAGEDISIFFGESDQSLAPLMVPSQLLAIDPFAVRMTAMRSGDIREVELPVAIVDDYETVAMTLLGGESFEDAPEVRLEDSELGGEVELVLDHYGVGDLISDGDEGFVRDEIALGMYRGNAVTIYTLGCPLMGGTREIDTDECDFIQGPSIATPDGYQLSGDGTFIEDINGDQLADVLFGLQGRAGRTVGFALQVEPGRFSAAELLQGVQFRPPPMPNAQSFGDVVRSNSELTAVADMDGDGRGDLVTISGIWTSFRAGVGQVPEYELGYEAPGDWREVLVADTNNDLIPDMVVRTQTDLVVLLGVDGVNYNLSRTTFPERVDGMLLGDFDGDLYTDVIILSQQRLSIGFNDGRGLPGSFEDVFSDIGRIAPTTLRSIDEDAIDDLAIMVRPGENDDLPPYLLNLRGNGTRRLSAPITINGQADALGFLDTPQGPVGIATELSMPEGEWNLRRVDQSSVIQDLLFEPEPLDFDDGCIFDPELSYTLTAIEVDDDDVEELLAMEAYRGNDPLGDDLPLLTPAILDLASPTSLACTRLEPTPPEVEGNITSVRVADIDDDGNPEIAVGYTGIRLFEGDTEQVGGGVVIWWGVSGGFAAPVTIPLLAEPSRFEGAFDFGEFDGTPGLEIIGVRDAYPEVFDIDIDTKEVQFLETLDNIRFEREDFDLVEVLDLNRDGVDDIVLASAEQTTVLLQRECAPADAADDRCTRSNPRE